MRRRRTAGFHDLGRVGWARPSCRVFKDRDDGTLYMLSHDSSGPSVVLTTPVPRRCNARPEEPIVEVSVGRRRFFVQGGSLQWEEVADSPISSTSADLWTVNFSEQKVTFRVDVQSLSTGEGEALLLTEDGEPLILTEGTDDTLDLTESAIFADEVVLTRQDLAQLP